jgi:hypothetical protein
MFYTKNQTYLQIVLVVEFVTFPGTCQRQMAYGARRKNLFGFQKTGGTKTGIAISRWIFF